MMMEIGQKYMIMNLITGNLRSTSDQSSQSGADLFKMPSVDEKVGNLIDQRDGIQKYNNTSGHVLQIHEIGDDVWSDPEN